MKSNRESEQSPSWWEVCKSIFAAALGVQSEDQRARDFTYGKPVPYIIAGLIFTVIFVASLLAVAFLVTPESNEHKLHPALKYKQIDQQ